MAMDGMIAGQLYARQAIARQLARQGTLDAAKVEKDRAARVTRPLQRTVVQSALSDGAELIDTLEARCKDALREAVTVNALKGVQPDWPSVGRTIHAILMDALEPAAKSGTSAELAFTRSRGERAQTLEEYRKARAQHRLWKQQQRELADWRAGRRKEPVWRLKARQQTTRMRTGWDRWYNQGQILRAQESPEVAYLMFTLGSSRNHTEICRNRAGMLINKNSPKLQEHRPPLHWGCRSKLVPITREEAKSNGWKQAIPKGLTGDAKPDPAFLVSAIRQKGN